DNELLLTSPASRARAARVDSAAALAPFPVPRTGATTADLTVNSTFAGTATNGADYTAIPASVTIPAGAASVTVTVSPIDDLLAEPSETVSLRLAASGAYQVGRTGTASGRVLDNVPFVTIVGTKDTASEEPHG